MFLKKRLQKKDGPDLSSIAYWQNRIKTGMKLNNSKLNESHLRYKNFVVPSNFEIEKISDSIAIVHYDINGIRNWYNLYKNGIPVEVIQEDIMSPGIDLPF